MSKMFMAKRLFLPPLVPFIGLVLLCAWVYWDASTGPGNIVDGHPDNSPMWASVILGMGSPIFYVFCVGLNWVDGLLDRFSGKLAWIGTLLLTVLIGLVLFFMFYEPKIDATPWFAVIGGFGTAAVFLLPMTVTRRFLIREKAVASLG